MKRMVHLARHGMHAEVGHVLSGRSEIALDARGRAEAEALAAHLAPAPIMSIHSSPRARARETAAPIARSKGLDILTAGALDEVDFGRFAGTPFKELARDPDWTTWNTERAKARCPGGESMAEAASRATRYIRSLDPEQTPALCVTHCDIIRGIVCELLGLGFERMFSFECDPGSLTTLLFEGSDARLLTLNERSWRRGS